MGFNIQGSLNYPFWRYQTNLGDNFEGFPLFFVHEVWVSIRRSASLGFIFTRFVGLPKTGIKAVVFVWFLGGGNSLNFEDFFF